MIISSLGLLVKSTWTNGDGWLPAFRRERELKIFNPDQLLLDKRGSVRANRCAPRFVTGCGVVGGAECSAATAKSSNFVHI